MTASGGAGRYWQTDLAILAFVTAGAAPALLVSGVPGAIEWALGLPLLLVAPGWALVSVALPGSPEASDGSPRRAADGPDWIVRLALTPPLSVLVVAAVTFLASATVGIRLVPVVAGVATVTGGCLLGAWLRRWHLAPDRRASPLGPATESAPSAFGSTIQRGTFLLALVALVSAVALAGANPPAAQDYTEFYVLTEAEDGDLVAVDYPDGSASGNLALSLAIDNHERRAMTYDVVARSVPTDGAGRGQQLDRFQTSIPAGERIVAQRTYPAATVTDDSQLQFLLYKDGVPPSPSEANAALTLSVGGDGGNVTAGPEGGNVTAGRDGGESVAESGGGSTATGNESGRSGIATGTGE